eukprot:gene9222-biopygen13746
MLNAPHNGRGVVVVCPGCCVGGNPTWDFHLEVSDTHLDPTRSRSNTEQHRATRKLRDNAERHRTTRNYPELPGTNPELPGTIRNYTEQYGKLGTRRSKKESSTVPPLRTNQKPPFTYVLAVRTRLWSIAGGSCRHCGIICDRNFPKHALGHAILGATAITFDLLVSLDPPPPRAAAGAIPFPVETATQAPSNWRDPWVGPREGGGGGGRRRRAAAADGDG